MVLVLALAAAFWAGCGKNSTAPPPPPPGVIDVTAIIVNPLSPAPGQTAILTAQAEGSGDPATYEWSVSGGTIADNGKITVTWNVPDTSKVYRIIVRGATGTSSDVDTSYVLARNYEAIDTGLKYSLYPQILDGQLYYTGTSTNPTDRSFLGYHVYSFLFPTTPIDKLASTPPTINGGYECTFFPDGVLTASITDGADYIRLQPTNVFFFPLVAGQKKSISNNEFVGTTFRKDQNIHPSASSDLGMYVWQYIKVGQSDDGTQDLVNIRFRAVAAIQQLTTSEDSVFQYGAWSYTYYRNIKPMFAPHDDAIIYFVDSTETFEPCIIPMSGIEPQTDLRHALMVDGRHGIFYYAQVKVSERTIFQWNPAVPTQVAFIDDSGKLCRFDYAAGTVEVLGTGVQEFAWSDDGKIAGATEDGVYVLEPGQTVATQVFAKERPSDGVIGVNWSRGTEDERIGFRLVRKGASPAESFSALVIYSVDDGRWYFGTGRIGPPMSTEPEVSYTWMRVVFDRFSSSVYMPVPITGSGGQVTLYRSY
jgi:hypothetical protein